MNPEIDQDRVTDLFELFNKSNVVMFHQQRRIYEHLSKEVINEYVLEAGCGTGQGTAMLSRTAQHILGTDKLKRNVDFARSIYPWLPFGMWDINKPSTFRAEVVVCVEALEHVQIGRVAVQNLLLSATRKIWISTPNGNGKPSTPINPFHVCEYTPSEMLDMIGSYPVTIRDWDTWMTLTPDTKIDPLVYEISK